MKDLKFEYSFDFIEGKHVPTVKILLPPCEADDNAAWDSRDKLASDIKAMLAAAPAEDASTVVEEPVAYAVLTDKGHIRIWSSDCEAVGLKVEAEEGRKAVPLYRHPQRPVVMPERKREFTADGVPLLENIKWNACLDEFKRLNP